MPRTWGYLVVDATDLEAPKVLTGAYSYRGAAWNGAAKLSKGEFAGRDVRLVARNSETGATNVLAKFRDGREV